MARLLGRGFQAVHGGVPAGTERGAAGLTPERLDVLGLTMRAIADERMEVSVSVAKGGALPVGTGEAFGRDADGALPAGFSPRARGAQEKTLALQLMRQWRRDDRRDNRVESEAMPQTWERSAPLGCSGRGGTKMGKAVGTQQRKTSS